MTDTPPTTGKLLTPSEREICLLIVSLETAPYSKRAQALLCLDEGITQKASCTITGLALGQLRYALSLFKNEGMAMFPQKVLPATDTTQNATGTTELEQQSSPEEGDDKDTPVATPEKAKTTAPRQKSFEEMSASISELLEKVEAAPEEEETPNKEKKKKKPGKKKKTPTEKSTKKAKKKEKAPKETIEKKLKKKKKTKKEISLKDLLEKEKSKKKAKKKEKVETVEKKGKKKKKSKKEKK